MILAQEEEEVSEVDEGVSVEVVEDDSREKDLNLQSMIQPPNHLPMKVRKIDQLKAQHSSGEVEERDNLNVILAPEDQSLVNSNDLEEVVPTGVNLELKPKMLLK